MGIRWDHPSRRHQKCTISSPTVVHWLALCWKFQTDQSLHVFFSTEKKNNVLRMTKLCCKAEHLFEWVWRDHWRSQRTADRDEKRSRAAEERRGKKLTALIWNQKRECNLAVTQILHLHLYKPSLPAYLPGSQSLYLFPLFLSTFSLSLSLSLRSMCAGLGRCHFQHVFYTLSTVC